MSDVDRQRLKAVFHDALDVEPAGLDAFLDSACEGDVHLRQQVTELLAAHRASGPFMDPPAMASAEAWASLEEADALGAGLIGSYRLLREIGDGGMGVVYLATRADDEYHKLVAIKIVKRGMDTGAILRRFRHERQTLADLDHPNIARLLDGGTTRAGLPYFVMEYVEGLPIDEYCDRHVLTTSTRLELFRIVCDGVQHAHRNLVVHRDLKPDNILVSPEGQPKLLDFGIAKLLVPASERRFTELTEPFGRPMTPGYASPEQVRGEPISTASDVYSLGVLLYELLTGHRPYRFDGQSFDEIARKVCDEVPERPSSAVRRTEQWSPSDEEPPITVTPESVSRSRGDDINTLSRRLAGDLDTIVQMAMHKEPHRRYGSVAQFSDDIRRHLAGLPVLAREDSAVYRARKFVARHRAAAAAVVVVSASLVAGIVATTYQARVAHTQRLRAERRFNDVRQLANSLLFELHDGIETLPGSTPLRELLVRRALEYLNSLSQEAGGSIELQRELATAYQKIGDVQGNPYRANIGHPDDALEAALGIFEAIAARDRGDIEARRGLAASHEKIGDVLALMSDVTGSLERQRQGLAIREALRGQHPASDAELATSYYKVGESLGWAGDLTSALTACRRALEMRLAIVASVPRDTDALLAVATSGVKVGELLAATGDRAGAMSQYREAQARAVAALEVDPLNARAQRQLAIAHTKIAEQLGAAGDAAAAAREHRTALGLRESMLKTDPTNAQARREVAISYVMAADAASTAGATADALDGLGRALQLFEELSAANPTNAAARADLVIGYRMAGVILIPTDPVAAVARLGQARALAAGLSGEDPADMEIRREMVIILSKLGDAYAAAGRIPRAAASARVGHWTESRRWYQEALGLSEELQKRGALSAADADAAALRAAVTRVDAVLGGLQRRATR